MIQSLKNFQKRILAGITIIALGITLMNAFSETKSVGIVLIAIGGLFYISGMKMKLDEVKHNE